MTAKTRKTVNILCQLLALVGIVGGIAAGCCMLLEMVDFWMELNHPQPMPEGQSPYILQAMVHDALDDAVEPLVAACASLAVALVSAVVALILTWLSPATTEK